MRKGLIAASALIALAACNDSAPEPDETGEEQAAPAAPVEPAPVENDALASVPTGGAFAEAPDCAELPAEAAAICLRPVLSAKPQEQLEVDMTRLDIDGDGALDMVLRRRSAVDCGTQGCATFVFFARDGDYVLADPPITASGPVEACRNDGEPGVRFPQSGDHPVCIDVTPQA